MPAWDLYLGSLSRSGHGGGFFPDNTAIPGNARECMPAVLFGNEPTPVTGAVRYPCIVKRAGERFTARLLHLQGTAYIEPGKVPWECSPVCFSSCTRGNGVMQAGNSVGNPDVLGNSDVW